MRTFRRRIFNGLTAVSLIACILALAAWPLTLRGRWVSLRRSFVAYNLILTDEHLIVQRAKLSRSAPTTWTFSHGRGGRFNQYGVVLPTSVFDELGLIDAMIGIPETAPPNQYAIVGAMGHSVTVSDWGIAFVSICVPTCWTVERVWRRRNERRPGFAVEASGSVGLQHGDKVL